MRCGLRRKHTRAGDAIAAARRRLPMVEVAPSATLTGPHWPVSLLEVFEGRGQLIWEDSPTVGRNDGSIIRTAGGRPPSGRGRPWFYPLTSVIWC